MSAPTFPKYKHSHKRKVPKTGWFSELFCGCSNGTRTYVLLRCPKKSSGLRFSSIFSTAATRSGRSSRPQRRSHRSPPGYELPSGRKSIAIRCFPALLCPLFRQSRRSKVHLLLPCPLSAVPVWVKTWVRCHYSSSSEHSPPTSRQPCVSC